MAASDKQRKIIANKTAYYCHWNWLHSTPSRDSVTRFFFFEGLNNLVSTFCAWADVFQGLSSAAEKMDKHSLVTGGFRYDFTEAQAAFCEHFQCQNRRFRIFEAGYFTRRIFKISKKLKRLKLWVWYFHQLRKK
jgi:hypothetical protein